MHITQVNKLEPDGIKIPMTIVWSNVCIISYHMVEKQASKNSCVIGMNNGIVMAIDISLNAAVENMRQA